MYEVWLRPNRRALWMAMGVPVLAAAGGLVGIFSGFTLFCVLGWVLTTYAVLLAGLLQWWMRQPRLAYETGHMLVYLRRWSPYRVPIDAVECFFLGSGPLKLSDHVNTSHRTVSLIVRMAEKAKDWADRPVKPALGRWAEGYIMIHGAWCEPLSLEVVSRLNVRLHEIQHTAAPAGKNPSASAAPTVEKTA